MSEKPDRTERQRQYDEFLGSNAWRRIRGEARSRLGKACVICGATRIQMHHIFYPERWEDTKIFHLIPLCKQHHDAAHQLPNHGICRKEDKIDRFRRRLVKQLGGEAEPAMKISPKKLKKMLTASLRKQAKAKRKKERMSKEQCKAARKEWKINKEGLWSPESRKTRFVDYSDYVARQAYEPPSAKPEVWRVGPAT